MTKPMETTVIRAVRPTGRNDLYHTVDGYDWVYENSSATKVDVARPGFFNVYREEMRAGAIIECRLGNYVDGITQVWLQIIEAPRSEGGGDVMVSVGPSRKFSPCRHDGTQDETSEEEKAA